MWWESLLAPWISGFLVAGWIAVVLDAMRKSFARGLPDDLGEVCQTIYSVSALTGCTVLYLATLVAVAGVALWRGLDDPWLAIAAPLLMLVHAPRGLVPRLWLHEQGAAQLGSEPKEAAIAVRYSDLQELVVELATPEHTIGTLRLVGPEETLEIGVVLDETTRFGISQVALGMAPPLLAALQEGELPFDDGVSLTRTSLSIDGEVVALDRVSGAGFATGAPRVGVWLDEAEQPARDWPPSVPGLLAKLALLDQLRRRDALEAPFARSRRPESQERLGPLTGLKWGLGGLFCGPALLLAAGVSGSVILFWAGMTLGWLGFRAANSALNLA